MGNDWNKRTLEQFAIHKKGFAFKSKDYMAEGLGIVRVSNLTDDSIDISDLKYLSTQQALDAAAFELHENDVVIATVGSWPKNPASVVGKVIKVPQVCNGFLLNQNAVRFRVKTKDVYDQLYLYSLLKSKKFSDYIISTAQGSANQASITLKDIYAFEFNCPPAEVRKRIAKQLSTLDQKIALNRQTNQTLEQMAQTLFKSWFVDFDPVFDNALLKAGISTQKSSSNEHDQQLLASFPEALRPKAKLRLNALRSKQKQGIPTQELGNEAFPSEFEFNEQLGWIPKGWASAQLGDLTTELRRGISPKYLEEGGVQVINQKCIRNHEVNFSFCRRNNPELRNITGRQLIVGDLLINSTGVGTLGRMAQVKYLEEETVIDSHVTIVRVKRDLYPAYSFAQMMLSMASQIEAIGEGSTGQTELSRKIVSELWVLVPQEQVLIDLDNHLKAYSDKMVLNTCQNIELTKLRDTLLPKLISGELQIPVAESLVKEMA